MHEESRAMEEILGSRERLLSVCVFKIEKQTYKILVEGKNLWDELSKDTVRWSEDRQQYIQDHRWSCS